ncbi:alpha/beta hydrolase [Xylophilus sp.]|uniref:alpha/beta hydrolase n=1 Tax=Xylophilus sp. TaxID=2653893 RepID=UPI0013B80799|nr:alpha/beta hydrolase-fold protein [Xylophilus sp.]KAF1050012.1 MAG: Ferri-bacillibactin esterase BesA [Xylophilus sp.]
MPSASPLLRRRPVLVAPLSLASLALGAGCAQTAPAADGAPWRLDAFHLASADGRRRYRIQLAIPPGAAPAAGRPVIYLLDGDATFAEITPAERARLAALPDGDAPVIAAIGYDTAAPLPTDGAAPALSPVRASGIDVAARAYDYTPRAVADGPTADEAGRPGGGADAFLDLIEQRIRPEVARRVPAALDPARQTFWGHSYGGLLTVYAFLTRPAMFTRFAAADPSLWWHGGYVLQVERRAAPPPAGRTTELLVMAGTGAAGGAARPGVDATAASRARAARGSLPPDAVAQFAARQAQRGGVRGSFRSFPGVSHGPLRAASLPLALELAAKR